ncbi:hypothetical protein K439DRAFT_1642297 [Ramaria rubella]|nr:hypothetical protein K439DRAFT_1642297 [Ramaria rubella]
MSVTNNHTLKQHTVFEEDNEYNERDEQTITAHSLDGDTSCFSPPNGVSHNLSCIPETSAPQRCSRLLRLRSLGPHIAPVLENSGSVARDHLANERTWLAYVRTSLAIAGTGVALVQLFTIAESEENNGTSERAGPGLTLQRFARPLGATTVIVALCILGMGVMRYFKIQRAMTEGKFPVARNTVVMITVVLAALVAVTFGMLIGVSRNT